MREVRAGHSGPYPFPGQPPDLAAGKGKKINSEWQTPGGGGVRDRGPLVLHVSPFLCDFLIFYASR